MEKKAFEELLGSIQEMNAIRAGKQKASRRFEYPAPEVKAIRKRVGVSQGKFAMILGVSKRTVESWEQGQRQPRGAARSLLKIVEADPEHALQSLLR